MRSWRRCPKRAHGESRKIDFLEARPVVGFAAGNADPPVDLHGCGWGMPSMRLLRGEHAVTGVVEEAQAYVADGAEVAEPVRRSTPVPVAACSLQRAPAIGRLVARRP